MSTAQQVAVSSAEGRPSAPMFVPKQPMNPKTKKYLKIGAIAVLILLIAFYIARLTNGPTTPEELRTKFADALTKKDTSVLVKLLENDKELSDSKSLAIFKNSINNDVIKAYIQALDYEIDNSDNRGFGVTSHRWLTVKQTTSWRGDSWRIHIVPVDLVSKNAGQGSIEFSIGDLKSDKGKIERLWPSAYEVKGKVSNAFASEDVISKVNVLGRLNSIEDFGIYEYELNLLSLVKSKLTLNFPRYVTNLQVLLNDKLVTVNSGSITISPAPSTGNVEIKATVLGVDIDEKGTIDPNLNIGDLLNAGIAKHALTIVYEAASSWTKAHNEGNPTLLKAVDPNGASFKEWSSGIKEIPIVKNSLQKVSIDPRAVNISEKALEVNVSEYYIRSDGSISTANWSYSLQQIPSKSEWWIEANYRNYSVVKDPTGTFTKSS